MGILSLLRTSHRNPAARLRRQTFTPGLGLGVENLESRVVLSHAAAEVASPVVTDLLHTVGSGNLNITGVNLTNLQIVDGVLTAAGNVTGTLAGLPFTAQITNFALQLMPDDPAMPGVQCSVLDLELAPINLSLLGLHVDTSPICLEITATQGGGLLGDLLCGLAGGGLLGTGTPTLPTAGQLTTLTGGLTNLLNGALNAAPAQPGGGDSVCTGQCDILDLSLGPIDLSLLGLNVSLDDCNEGPVQVCVSATASEGLLGSLLCGLAGTPTLPIPGLNLNNLDLKDITKLVNRATDLLEDGVLSAKDIGKLTDQLIKALRK